MWSALGDLLSPLFWQISLKYVKRHTYEAKNFQIAHQNFMKKRVFKFVTFPTTHSGPRQKITLVHIYIPFAIQKHKKLH